MALHSGRLTPSDASFLYVERPEAPMHIGAVAILDGEIPFDHYLDTIEAKLGRLPRFRERIVPPPLYLGHPTWETAADFDVRQHVIRHQLEKPGDMETLRRTAGHLIEGMMDRERPLWQLNVVYGLEGDRSAIVSKVHHAMVDGVGGNEILTTVLDLSPEPRRPEPKEYEPTTGMDTRERVVEAIWDATRLRIDSWSEYFKSLTELGRSFDAERLRTTIGVLADRLPDLALPPRRLPFNRRCNGQRELAWTELSFAEARAIRGALGGTVNDVILAGLAGAVSRYCELHGHDTSKRTMRVMVPVNVRREEDQAALGNQVSVMPVAVPLDVDDPKERLRVIRESTRALKAAHVSEGVSLMSTLMGTIPAPFQAALGSLAVTPTPVFNMVCTNVPGPQIPLYAEGVPMIAYYPYIPTGFDMGVGCAIFSYNQRLFFGLAADVGACPDVTKLGESLTQEFEDLKREAGVGKIPDIRVGARRSGERPAKKAAAATRRPARKKSTKRGAAVDASSEERRAGGGGEATGSSAAADAGTSMK